MEEEKAGFPRAGLRPVLPTAIPTRRLFSWLPSDGDRWCDVPTSGQGCPPQGPPQVHPPCKHQSRGVGRGKYYLDKRTAQKQNKPWSSELGEVRVVQAQRCGCGLVLYLLS